MYRFYPIQEEMIFDNFEKDRLTKIGGKIGGPGYYKTDSYFDWNKKSYNILFN